MAEFVSGPKLPRQTRFSRDGMILVLIFSSMIIAGLSFQQGRTIESQRNMIRTLFLDSKELSALKMRDLQQKHAAATANQNSEATKDKSDSKDTCTPSKDKNCETPQAAAPSKASPDKNQAPENSDDDSSLPNPQRLLHSI